MLVCASLWRFIIKAYRLLLSRLSVFPVLLVLLEFLRCGRLPCLLPTVASPGPITLVCANPPRACPQARDGLAAGHSVVELRRKSWWVLERALGIRIIDFGGSPPQLWVTELACIR